MNAWTWEWAAAYLAGMLVAAFIMGMSTKRELDGDDGLHFVAALVVWPVTLLIVLAANAYDVGWRIKSAGKK